MKMVNSKPCGEMRRDESVCEALSVHRLVQATGLVLSLWWYLARPSDGLLSALEILWQAPSKIIGGGRMFITNNFGVFKALLCSSA